MKKLIWWIRELLFIIGSYRARMNQINESIDYLREQSIRNNNNLREGINLIRERTEISADVHFRGNDRNQIIVVGRYRNMDYINVFTLNNNDFKHMIEQLKCMQKYGVVEKIDSMPGISATIKRDFLL